MGKRKTTKALAEDSAKDMAARGFNKASKRIAALADTLDPPKINRNPPSSKTPSTEKNVPPKARISEGGAIVKPSASTNPRKAQGSPNLEPDSEVDKAVHYKRPSTYREASKAEWELNQEIARAVKRNASPEDSYQCRLMSFTKLDEIKDEKNRIQRLLSCCRHDGAFLMSPFVNSLEAELEELTTFEETLEGRARRYKTTNEPETITGAILYKSTRNFRGVARKLHKLEGDLEGNKIIAAEVKNMADTAFEPRKILSTALDKAMVKGDTEAFEKIQLKLTALDLSKELVGEMGSTMASRTQRLRTISNIPKQ